MYNPKTDENNKRFGLNKDLVNLKGMDKVKILQTSSIDYIKSLENSNLIENSNSVNNEQLTFLLKLLSGNIVFLLKLLLRKIRFTQMQIWLD
jgi:hypothetical protein